MSFATSAGGLQRLGKTVYNMILFYPVKRSFQLFTCVCACLLSYASIAQSYTLTAFRNKSLAPSSLGFYESLPGDYETSGKAYPLLIVMHGAGDLGNGNDQLDKVLQLGIGKRLAERTLPESFTAPNGDSYSFIIIMPQLYTEVGGIQSLNTIIDSCIARYRVLTNRIYITGCSMGGGITWNAVGMSPGMASRVAAIVPMAPHAPYSAGDAANIAGQNLPVWSLHNHYDDVVSFERTNEWVDGINGFSPTPAARKTIFEVVGHDVWTQATDPTYRENSQNIYEWMLGYARGLDVLPVRLSSFTAKKVVVLNLDKVELQWATSSELNNAYFDVERSADGLQFSSIGRVRATDIATGGSYLFTDQAPLRGIGYYRLRQVDRDGRQTYSTVQSVRLDEPVNALVSLYPNPARDQVTLRIMGNSNGNMLARIVSASGITVKTIRLNKSSLDLVTTISLASITPGYYLLELMQDNAVSRQPFLIH